MKKSKSLTNFEKIRKITNILYEELSNNNKFSNLNKLVCMSSILYKEIFDEQNITTLSKFRKIVDILYSEFIIHDKEQTVHLYGKLYNYVSDVLYLVEEPNVQNIDMIIESINYITDEYHLHNIITEENLVFIINILKLYQNNHLLQNTCLNSLLLFTSNNTENCERLCNLDLVQNLQILLEKILYKTSFQLRLLICQILHNLSKYTLGRKKIGINGANLLIDFVSEGDWDIDVLTTSYGCLANLCLNQEIKDIVINQKFLEITSQIFNESNSDDKLISNILLFLINLCYDVDGSDLNIDIILNTEFIENIIKYIINYLFLYKPYKWNILKLSCQFLATISNTNIFLFSQHFLISDGIKLLYILRHITYDDFDYRDIIFTYSQRIIDSLDIDSSLIFDELYTSLHIAALNNDHRTLHKILVNNQININVKNRNDNTALHIAIKYNRRKNINYLVCAGINIHIKNNQNQSALDISNIRLTKHILKLNKQYKNIKHLITNTLSEQLNINKDIPCIIFKYFDIYTFSFNNCKKIL